MKITLLALGTGMPSWVSCGFAEYAKRLPHDYALELVELTLPKRSKTSDLKRLLQQEAHKLVAAIPEHSLPIALTPTGQAWDTPKLAKNIRNWHDQSQSISLLIGGPDGFAPEVLQHCSLHWSLSNLTLPHPLVRIIVAEQLYRAYSLIIGHPYHR